MQYRKDKYGKDISLLGYGCMRFTQKGRSIDIDKAEKELMAAIEAGVNYFDTAYIYSGSEVALGEIFSRNPVRDKINIATKLPQYLIKSRKGGRYVLHGSANLRSSGCIEQIELEESPALYDFYMGTLGALIEKYPTINHARPNIARGERSWQAVLEGTREQTASAPAPRRERAARRAPGDPPRSGRETSRSKPREG